METITMTKFLDNFDALLNALASDELPGVIISNDDGKELAVLLSFDTYAALKRDTGSPSCKCASH